MSSEAFTSIFANEIAERKPLEQAHYWLVSSDGRVSCFGTPYWGGPTTQTETVGMYIEQPAQRCRGYALIGPQSWQRYGPEAPAEPIWLNQGKVERSYSGPGGCWALFSDGRVCDPEGNFHHPPEQDEFVDFAVTDVGVIWLHSDGRISGAQTRASNTKSRAVSVNICAGQILVVNADGSIDLPDGSNEISLCKHLFAEVVSATSKDGSLWLVTASGTVYGWGDAQHGGNLHAPRPNESIVALCV